MLTLIFLSCGDDDGFRLTSEDIEITIDENPEEDQTLGIVSTNGSSPLFSIVSQNPDGAFELGNNGELRVLDASLFDFETNPTLTATIAVEENGQESLSEVNITLNNVDDIASFLTISKQDYLDAEDNTWIVVTEDEYNALAAHLNEITKSGTSDEEYNQDETNFSTGSNFTRANNNGHNIPQNSYLFAFKYMSSSASSSVPTTKVKLSETSVSEGFYDVGSILPDLIFGNNFFVLKGSNNKISSTGFLAIYHEASLFIKNINGIFRFESGDSNILNLQSGGYVNLYQGLSSTQKQWD